LGHRADIPSGRGAAGGRIGGGQLRAGDTEASFEESFPLRACHVVSRAAWCPVPRGPPTHAAKSPALVWAMGPPSVTARAAAEEEEADAGDAGAVRGDAVRARGRLLRRGVDHRDHDDRCPSHVPAARWSRDH
ncbi:unnamed protein product, partial [Lampetra planeri]